MTGLTSNEAAKLLQKNGYNTFSTDTKSKPLKIFANQFKDIMVLILIAATIISVFLGEIYDSVTIILIVMLNAILGFIQEYKTEKTLEELKKMLSDYCKREKLLNILNQDFYLDLQQLLKEWIIKIYLDYLIKF